MTGVKFVKKNSTVYIQIQQGKLLPLGLIDPSTVHWKNITYEPDSEMVQSSKQTKFKLDWKAKSGLHLDYLRLLSYNDVVTGVRFTVSNDEKNYLKLEIRGTPMNYFKGHLMVNESYWFTIRSKFER